MQNLTKILEVATSRIESSYFQLYIDGGAPVFRERVYCYELYHQMRSIWPKDSLYFINGEVDKKAHPIISKTDAADTKPDLLVHKPGSMAGNFAVIEVKQALSRTGVKKDLFTMNRFLREIGYRKAIYLIYGDAATEGGAAIIYNAACEVAIEFKKFGPIELWMHSQAGVPAEHHSTLQIDLSATINLLKN